jgi:hypothetical protein
MSSKDTRARTPKSTSKQNTDQTKKVLEDFLQTFLQNAAHKDQITHHGHQAPEYTMAESPKLAVFAQTPPNTPVSTPKKVPATPKTPKTPKTPRCVSPTESLLFERIEKEKFERRRRIYPRYIWMKAFREQRE